MNNFLADQKVVIATKFYCARYPAIIDQIKHNRDDALFANLTSKGITVLEGKYKFDHNDLKLPPKEKGVDVLLATDLLYDGIMDNFDCAYVVSDDSDLIPAIKKLHTIAPSKDIFQATFAPRQEWREVCKYVIQLYPNKMKKFVSHLAPTQATLSDLANKFKK